MSDEKPIWSLVTYLALLSLIAVGGINSSLPDMHRVFVDEKGWLTAEQFASYYALAQTAPGPNFMFSTVVGWHLGGISGALLASLATCGPSSLIVFILAGTMHSWDEIRSLRLVRASLVPVTVGLISSSAFLLTQAAATDWKSYLVTAATALFVLCTRLNPLWALAAAGLGGVAGLL
jgi:chromate transporter